MKSIASQARAKQRRECVFTTLNRFLTGFIRRFSILVTYGMKSFSGYATRKTAFSVFGYKEVTSNPKKSISALCCVMRGTVLFYDMKTYIIYIYLKGHIYKVIIFIKICIFVCRHNSNNNLIPL